MFIPNDGAMISAIDNDDAIVSYAPRQENCTCLPFSDYERNNACCADMAQRGARPKRDRNRKTRGLFYDSAKDFLSDLQSIEKNLAAAHRSYESALSRLTSGSRSFLARAERLRDLGAKTSRRP